MADAKSALIRKLQLFGYALEAGRRESSAVNGALRRLLESPLLGCL
jgi:hypothetical protein